MHRTAPSTVHFASLGEINDPSVGNTELYGRTKLAIILGIKYGIVERVIKKNGDNIYALSVHPGAVSLSKSYNSLKLKMQGQHRYAAAVERCVPGTPW